MRLRVAVYKRICVFVVVYVLVPVCLCVYVSFAFLPFVRHNWSMTNGCCVRVRRSTPTVSYKCCYCCNCCSFRLLLLNVVAFAVTTASAYSA